MPAHESDAGSSTTPPLGSASSTSTAIVSDALVQLVLHAAPHLGTDRAQDHDGCELADDGSGPAIGPHIPLPPIPEIPVGDEAEDEAAVHGGGCGRHRSLSDVEE